jgi:hypothetical protein
MKRITPASVITTETTRVGARHALPFCTHHKDDKGKGKGKACLAPTTTTTTTTTTTNGWRVRARVKGLKALNKIA